MYIITQSVTYLQDVECFTINTNEAAERSSFEEQPRSPLEDFEKAYKLIYGKKRVPMSVYAEVNSFRACGVALELIINAVEECETISRPAWAYARKIITNCVREGVLDMDAYIKRQAAFAACPHTRTAPYQYRRPMITRMENNYAQAEDENAYIDSIMRRAGKKTINP